MSTQINTGTSAQAARTQNRRSIEHLLAPLGRLARTSANLLEKPFGQFESEGQSYQIPRYLFVGPQGGDEPIRVGIFAAVHGDEPEGAHALVKFLSLLDYKPELARGFCLFVYPLCNPTGFEDNTRNSRRGRDLNREFWKGSTEPEVESLQKELCHHALHGIISLHSDDTSHGMYGFVSGATLTRHLLKPALDAAEALLPRNQNEIIDGFAARNGIIRKSYEGVLCAPPQIRPRPFEIILETPQAAPQYRQEQAFVASLQAILTEYRQFIAYARHI